MVKRYLLAGIGFFFGISSVLYGADLEVTLEDSTTASGFSVKDSGSNTLMRVRGDGNVGIGRTDPRMILHLNDPGREFTIQVMEYDNSAVGFGEVQFTDEIGIPGNPLPYNWSIGALSRGYTFDEGPPNGFYIYHKRGISGETVNEYRLVINSTGNVGIGTTNPSHPLTMGSGAHVTSGGVWTNVSSRDYKENIETLTLDEAVATFTSLRPVKFNYKADKSESYVGFIAEDVPRLVATKDRKGLSPMDLTAVLTKVVQEQRQMILKLSERLKQVESKL